MRMALCTLPRLLWQRLELHRPWGTWGKGRESLMSTHLTYMAALQAIIDQYRPVLKLVPHHGGRGRIAEEVIKSVFSRTLPKRFSIGTGIIISAHGEVSRQTDIVIYDNFFNAPLLSEFSSGI